MTSAVRHLILEVSIIVFASVVVPLAAYSFEPRVYIALGDSVPAGFGVAETERYTALFFDKLSEHGIVDTYVNFAEDGLTTAALLSFLRSMDEHQLSYFQYAHVITLNIGGNDILAPLVHYLPTAEGVVDIVFELWDFVQASMAIVPEVLEIAAGFQDALEDFSLWRVWELPGLNRMVQDASPVLGEVADMFDRVGELQLVQLLPILEGEFSPELEAALASGVDGFADDFSEILKWLELHAPDAVIIVNTVYNPVPDQMLGMTLAGLSDRAGELIQAMNAIVVDGSAAHGYMVADVYAAFADAPDSVMNFFVDTSALTLSLDVIHPSTDGHVIIAGVVYEVFVAR